MWFKYFLNPACIFEVCQENSHLVEAQVVMAGYCCSAGSSCIWAIDLQHWVWSNPIKWAKNYMTAIAIYICSSQKSLRTRSDQQKQAQSGWLISFSSYCQYTEVENQILCPSKSSMSILLLLPCSLAQAHCLSPSHFLLTAQHCLRSKKLLFPICCK